MLDTEGGVQLSVAVGGVHVAMVVVNSVFKAMLLGQGVKTGGVTSFAQIAPPFETVT